MIGSEVTKYRIESEIGRGGMGVVYKAVDATLGRTVALKFLPPALNADEAARSRFIHEAKSISALDHPNIAVVHEIGESDDGKLFIVMGYYPGETLDEVIARGPLAPDVAVDYARQIASGLLCAHEKGIAHRDIKPGNVMVTESGLLKILDFGLAKVQDVTMTVMDMSLGTPAYSSPEQSRNDNVDHRTDLWALGVVMYEMLTGVRPFDGGYPSAVLYAVLNEPHESVRSVNPDVPERLSAVVDRLLEKDVAKRYQSADDVLADLENRSVTVVPHGAGVQASTTVIAEVVPGGPVARAPRRSVAAGVVGAAAVLVLLAVFVFRGSDEGSTTAASTVDSRTEAREHLDSGIEYLNDGQYSLALAELEQAVSLDSTYATAWSSMSAAYEQLGDHTAAVDAARRAISLDGEDPGSHYNLGYALASRGEADAAIDAFRRATELDPRFTAAYSAWGDLLVENGEPEAALEVLERARPTAGNLLFLIYKNMGKARIAMGQHEDAAEYLESSLNLTRWPETMWLLGQTYERLGQTEAAREMYTQYISAENDPVAKGRARERLANL